MCFALVPAAVPLRSASWAERAGPGTGSRGRRGPGRGVLCARLGLPARCWSRSSWLCAYPRRVPGTWAVHPPPCGSLKLRRLLQATGPHLRPWRSVSPRTLRSGSAQTRARADPASPAVPGSGRHLPQAWPGLGGGPWWGVGGGPIYPSFSRSISTNGFLSRRQAA